MTAPTTDPVPAPPQAPVQPAPTPLFRATAVIATIGVVVALVGLAMLLRPVTTPTQDCGTSLAFLLEGRVNEFVSVDDPPAGVSAADAEANNAEPCRVRVGERAKPAGVLLLAGLTAAIGAAVVELSVRGAGWWKRRRVGRDQRSTPTSPPTPPAAAATD